MREKGCASWDRGKRTWGGRERGWVLFLYGGGAQEWLGKRDDFGRERELRVLCVMPLDNLKFSDNDDSTLRVDIASRLPVDNKTVELLKFAPSVGDSPEGMLVVAYWFLNPHCPRHQVFNPLDVPVICCLCLGDISSILTA
nr:hypothetical protein [Tanacetum cinerariifolium]